MQSGKVDAATPEQPQHVPATHLNSDAQPKPTRSPSQSVIKRLMSSLRGDGEVNQGSQCSQGPSTTLLPGDKGGDLEMTGLDKVAVVAEEVEWGEGLGLSSSSSDDGIRAVPWRQRNMRQSSSSRSISAEQRVQVQEDNPRSFFANYDEDGGVAEESHALSWLNKTPEKENCGAGLHISRFLFRASLHIADFALRIASVCIYWKSSESGEPLVTNVLIPILILGASMAGYITFRDTDVILWMEGLKGRNILLRICFMLGVFLVFGCLQLIQVKRAWARQLQTAQLETEMRGKHDKKKLAAEQEDSTPPFSGAERGLPVSLFTAVPFFVVNIYCTRTREYLWNQDHRMELSVIITSDVVLLVVVALGIVEIDMAVSARVHQRFLGSTLKYGVRPCVYNSFYCVAHLLFRAAEVLLRLEVITGVYYTMRGLGAVRTIPAFYAFFDYVFGVGLLRFHARDKEKLLVHLCVGVMFLLADLAHFVDQPTFAAPAHRISCYLSLWRVLNVVGVLVLMKLENLQNKAQEGHQSMWIPLLVICTVVYYALWLLPIIRRVGADMHTAARAGNLPRIRKLLAPVSGGQVLDLNATTKDKYEMTPLMLAAAGGHLDVIELLIEEGGQLNAQSASGDTCLHCAARNFHAAACRRLLQAGCLKHIANNEGLTAEQVVLDKLSKSQSNPFTAEVLQALQEQRMSRHTKNDENLSYPAEKKFKIIPAQQCKTAQLRSLFPDAAADDDAPSPRVLHSTSGLVFSRVLGSMSRKLLARVDGRGEISLGALRPVGEIGSGGFGRVIKVELPGEAFVNLWGQTEERPRQFALKLQLKQYSENAAASEVLALRHATHPFVVRLEHAFQTPKFFALLLELCKSDLNRKLCEVTGEDGRCLGLVPSVAARYMGQVLLAVVHLNDDLRIVYRDLKPENILIADSDDAKLADFGLAKVVTSAERMTMCGTMGFLPPELSLAGVDDGESDSSDDYDLRQAFKVDAYSYGVTLMITLLGEDAAQKREVKKKGSVILPLPLDEGECTALLRQLCDTGRLSNDALDLLVDHLLPFHPNRRSTLSSLVNHSFFLKELGCSDLRSHLLPEWN